VADAKADAAADGDPAALEVLYEAEVSARASGGPDKHVSFAVDDSDAVIGMSGSLAASGDARESRT
jgi:hypothetical protein